jgi:hypothetical protein
MVDTNHSRPTVVIAEPHHGIACALEDVVTLAGCVPITVRGLDSVSALDCRPLAIVLRIATEMSFAARDGDLLSATRGAHPPIVALASTEADVAEAARLDCAVIAQAPHQVRMLYDTLLHLASSRRLARAREG